MEELNLDNIVSFKAVDVDGNEQNVTVDDMVSMVASRMASAVSEASPMSAEMSTYAATAATGNDVYENELPIVSDYATVRVVTSDGTPAQATKQTEAKVVEELIGVATAAKDGLLSSSQVINNFQMRSMGNSRVCKIASFSSDYSAISIRGLEIVTGTVINYFIYRLGDTALHVKGDAFPWIEIKTDPKNIDVYVRVATGRSLNCRIEAMGTDNVMDAMAEIDSFPSDAVDIPFT